MTDTPEKPKKIKYVTIGRDTLIDCNGGPKSINDVPGIGATTYTASQIAYILRGEWREYAACSKFPKSLKDEFFPIEKIRGTKVNKDVYDACQNCPVQNSCLAEAFISPLDIIGVRGGTIEIQRKALIEKIGNISINVSNAAGSH